MYAFSFEVPGNESTYQQVKERLGDVPDGQLMMLVSRSDHGLRHLAVWRSQEEWQHYRDTTVRPAVAAMLASLGIPEPPAPEEHELSLVDLQR